MTLEGASNVDFYNADYATEYPDAIQVAIDEEDDWTMQTSHIWFSEDYGYKFSESKPAKFNMQAAFVKVPPS